MVASRQSQPLLSSDDTWSVIRSRIEEKRLYEARFLCRKLGQGLTAEQKATFERELASSMVQVEQLRQQAQGLMSRGEHGPARALYAQLEAIAIDVPGVAEEIKALAGAEALAARLAKPAVEAVAPVLPQMAAPLSVSPVERTQVQEELPPKRQCAQSGKIQPRIWWLVGLGSAVLCALAVLVFSVGQDSKQNPAVVAPQTDRIAVQPQPPALIPKEAEPTPQAPGEDSGQLAPPSPAPSVQETRAEPEPPPVAVRPALKLGGLQIEQSGHR